jgi:16S rRNA (adenine1518-N6/adenine1519-N6)-dimethyltransferase
MSISPKKSLGQHFLTDKNIITKIVQSVEMGDGGRVIEIGPGTGALTGQLFAKYPKLEAIEIDPRSVEFLNEQYPGLVIQQMDVLKTDWESIGSSVGIISVVGNLPYYITSPILFSVLDNRGLFKEAVFMMQKEVAERLVAIPRTKAYGILSVQTQIWSDVEYLFTVSRHVFNPKPNVESAVVKLKFDKPVPEVDPVKLKLVIRTAFNQRRKTLSNAIKTLLHDQMTDVDSRHQFSEKWQLNRRAEELTPQEFVELTNALYSDVN